MYRDLRAHLRVLEERGLLHRIDRAINKDTEMHPLVRWQYRGGIAEADRRAFLFTNVVDALGRHYDAPVLVGGLAGTGEIYTLGLDTTAEGVGERWEQAFSRPIAPVLVEEAPVYEVVHQGGELNEPTGGLFEFPVPISTPGWDNAPYLTSAQFVTRDPETGICNVGNYRGQIKSRTTCGIYFAAHGNDAAIHWEKARRRGEDLPAAIVVGAPPVVTYVGVQRVPFGLDELTLAGGLAGAPIPTVRCRTVDLEVPADAEVVIEGHIRTGFLEPEGPFGESHGHVHPRSMSPVMEVTYVGHRRDYIWTSFISQVTPSESSAIKKLGAEAMYRRLLQQEAGIRSVTGVVVHEALTNTRPVIFIQFRDPEEGDVWRALRLVSGYRRGEGKVAIAVDEDIDPHNDSALFWALAYRTIPHRDVQIVRGFDKGHAPPFDDIPAMENSALLINATLRRTLPPVSLPKRAFMEHARDIWQEIGLPPLRPETPWYGYSLGEWDEELDQEAQASVEGRWEETARKLATRRVRTGDDGTRPG